MELQQMLLSEVESSSPNAPLSLSADEKIGQYTNSSGNLWLFLRFPFIWISKEKLFIGEYCLQVSPSQYLYLQQIRVRGCLNLSQSSLSDHYHWLLAPGAILLRCLHLSSFPRRLLSFIMGFNSRSASTSVCREALNALKCPMHCLWWEDLTSFLSRPSGWSFLSYVDSHFACR